MQLHVLVMRLGTETRLLEGFENPNEASDLASELEEFFNNCECDCKIPPAYTKYIRPEDLHIDVQKNPDFTIESLSYIGPSKLSSIPKKYVRKLINLSHEKGWVCKIMHDFFPFEKREKELSFSLENEKGNFWSIQKNGTIVASIGLYNHRFTDKVLKALEFLEV